MSKWKKEVLEEITNKESSIDNVSKARNGYVTVTMENGDVLNCNINQIRPYLNKEGLVLTYDIEKAFMFIPGEVEKQFNTNNMKNIKAKNEGQSIAALRGLNLEDIVFFDIETVRNSKKLYKKNKEEWAAFKNQVRNWPDIDPENDKQIKDLYEEKAGLMAPYSKVFCISFGKFNSEGELKVITYHSENELEVLESFAGILNKLYRSTKKFRLCGQSIKNFDIPYLMQRYIINGMPVPDMLDVSDKKPWEITCLDTKELFKGTGMFYYGLSSIAHSFGLENPKNGTIEGSKVSEAFYDGKLMEIAEYCEIDVYTTANVTRVLMGLEPVEYFNSELYLSEEEE